MMMRLILNTLAISGSALFAGVLLAIGVTLGGYWRSLTPEAFLDWFGRNVRFIMRAIPLVAVPTIVGLAGSPHYEKSALLERNFDFGATRAPESAEFA